MINKSYLKKLLKKYLNGDITDEEQGFLMEYYDLFDDKEISELLSDEERERVKHKMNKAIWEKISTVEKGKTLAKRRWSLKIAAAVIVLMIGSSLTLYFFMDSPGRKEISASEQRLVALPDGSSVLLSTGSEIDYGSFEDSDKREVYLNGEAFFKVERNPQKPFIVHTGKIKTTVLGTSFRIKAWPLEKDISVDVSTGLVDVSDQERSFGVLKRNEGLVYDKNSGEVEIKGHSDEFDKSWQTQDLFLDNITMKEAASLIENRFHVNIEFKDEELLTKRFSTTFLKGESMDELLKILCHFNEAEFHFDEEGNTVTISKL